MGRWRGAGGLATLNTLTRLCSGGHLQPISIMNPFRESSGCWSAPDSPRTACSRELVHPRFATFNPWVLSTAASYRDDRINWSVKLQVLLCYMNVFTSQCNDKEKASPPWNPRFSELFGSIITCCVITVLSNVLIYLLVVTPLPLPAM